MDSYLEFRLNDGPVRTDAAPGTPALDYIRSGAGLSGTKEGCREGDCGACAVLLGSPVPGGGARYRAVPSCLLALGDVQGCHLVTIEGLVSGAPGGLTPVMRAFLEENASQCGFCSPGFIVSLTAWLAAPGTGILGEHDLAGAMAAVDGNLCRCTGYGSIRRAATRLAREFRGLPTDPEARLERLVIAGVLPKSVLDFAAETRKDLPEPAVTSGDARRDDVTALGGGTDYFVRNPDPCGSDARGGFSPILLSRLPGFTGVALAGSEGDRRLEIGAATRVADFFAAPELRSCVPGIERFEREFASTLVRNLATLGGNIANASPVGDLVAMLMALGADLEIVRLRDGTARSLPLDRFFLGYKKTDLSPGEALRRVIIQVPDGAGSWDAATAGLSRGGQAALAADHGSSLRFSFEKAAKRKNLDIAAVNSALSFRLEGGAIAGARLSAGGVAPVPLLLKKASALLEGVRADSGGAALAAVARAVAATAEGEISPIGDVRGSAEYRRRMTGRFVLAHFLRLFPDSGIGEELFP